MSKQKKKKYRKKMCVNITIGCFVSKSKYLDKSLKYSLATFKRKKYSLFLEKNL